MSDEQQVWDQIADDLRAQMPGLTDGDVVLIARLLVKQMFGDGPSVDELCAEHAASPGPHDETCAACGFFDAAKYHARTGRSLAADFLGLEKVTR